MVTPACIGASRPPAGEPARPPPGPPDRRRRRRPSAVARTGPNSALKAATSAFRGFMALLARRNSQCLSVGSKSADLGATLCVGSHFGYARRSWSMLMVTPACTGAPRPPAGEPARPPPGPPDRRRRRRPSAVARTGPNSALKAATSAFCGFMSLLARRNSQCLSVGSKLADPFCCTTRMSVRASGCVRVRACMQCRACYVPCAHTACTRRCVPACVRACKGGLVEHAMLWIKSHPKRHTTETGPSRLKTHSCMVACEVSRAR